MGEILNPHKLEIFDPEEDYDVDKLNENTRKINESIAVMERAFSTVNGNDLDFRKSTFTRYKTGNVGFVVADFHAILKAGKDLIIPSNINSALSIADVIPQGYQPRQTIGLQMGPVFSGEGRGDNLQGGISGNAFLLRSIGAGFTRASAGSVILFWNTSWGI